MSLIGHFKKNPSLSTKVGEFNFERDLGEGGNAKVLCFKRGGQSFAVKFIPFSSGSKHKRFVDEFFCVMQMPSHVNIVRPYHFDQVSLSGAIHSDGDEYSIIIMKVYDQTLHGLGDVSLLPVEERAVKAKRLFEDLCAALLHLHRHGVIHRDIKPKNIFFDSGARRFVLGDLGIAHFSDDQFVRAAKTDPKDRMANYLFSAPEQSEGNGVATAASDIYALSQVVQWYLTGATIRALGRRQFSGAPENSIIEHLDSVVSRGLLGDPASRFQSVEGISAYLQGKKEVKVDPLAHLFEFDDVIRSTIPEIDRVACCADQQLIGEFAEKLTVCHGERFWWMAGDEGDGHFRGLVPIGDGKWLINDDMEIAISCMLVYRDEGYLYKSFVVLLCDPDQPFAMQKMAGGEVLRKVSAGWSTDEAVLVDGEFYIDDAEVKNGYYRKDGASVKVDWTRLQNRRRPLVPWGIIIVPNGSATARMNNRNPTGELIRACIRDGVIEKSVLTTFLDQTRPYHSTELTKYD